MRHRTKRTKEYDSGIQKVSLLLRNMLTSLVLHGKIVTTSKRAYMLKAYANHFFARCVRMYKNNDGVYARRETIRLTKATIFSEQAGKHFVDVLLPKFLESTHVSYVRDIKLGMRKGDGAEEVHVSIQS
ncbi:MAG: bL17 family ribosomal protein [Candidatus Absconditabacterales bacterium]|nr:bL17 family ribosomal protein [Candidatus Absconditabacterales bacterium]